MDYEGSGCVSGKVGEWEKRQVPPHPGLLPEEREKRPGTLNETRRQLQNNCRTKADIGLPKSLQPDWSYGSGTAH